MGHLDIIGRAADVFDQVIVGVVNQPVRKSKTLFSRGGARRRSSRTRPRNLGNVQVKPFDTLLVDFAREHGAKAIVKGLRAISDFEYEFEMNQLNRKMAPDIESIYLMASPQYSFLSLKRHQGAGHVRRRHQRARARPRGRALAGSA